MQLEISEDSTDKFFIEYLKQDYLSWCQGSAMEDGSVVYDIEIIDALETVLKYYLPRQEALEFIGKATLV